MNLNEGSYLFKIPQLCTNLFQLFFHRLTQTTLILLIHPFLVTSLSFCFIPQMVKTQTKAMLQACTADWSWSSHSPAPQQHSKMWKSIMENFFSLGNLSEAEIIGLRETSFQHKLCSDGFQLELTWVRN